MQSGLGRAEQVRSSARAWQRREANIRLQDARARHASARSQPQQDHRHQLLPCS